MEDSSQKGQKSWEKYGHSSKMKPLELLFVPQEIRITSVLSSSSLFETEELQMF